MNKVLLKNKDVLDTRLNEATTREDALTVLTEAVAASAGNGEAIIQVNEGKSTDVIDLLVANCDRAQQRQKALDRKLVAQKAAFATKPKS